MIILPLINARVSANVTCYKFNIMNTQHIIGALLLYSATAASAPMRLPSETDIREVIQEFAEAYVCPNNQLTLMESIQGGLSCPKGQNALPMIYNGLKAGKWGMDKVMPLATGEFDLFQPKNIDQLVNVGSASASVVVIEYTDPQCPFCSHFMNNQFARIKERFIDTGKVQYRYHHTPLPYHKDAFLASEASYCAADQNAYAAYHQILLSDTQKQTRNDLIDHARQSNLNVDEFTQCLDSHKYKSRVGEEMALIDRVTPITYPFFVIGHYESGEFKTQSVYGAPWLNIIDIEKLTSIIDKEVSSKG